MKQNRLSISFAQSIIGLAMITSLWAPAFGQDSDLTIVRSRAEHLAERRKIQQAYPELVRALRTLHLPPDKMAEVEKKLKHSELTTRAVREELQSLFAEESRQDYDRQATNPARTDELRTSLKHATEQLQSDIKTLLTPQQAEQFDRHVQKQVRQKETRGKRSR